MDIRYAAGLLDGEGCIRIRTNFSKKTGQRWAQLTVEITNTHFPVLHLLKEQWGGFIYTRKVVGNRRVCGGWVISTKQAAAFLAEVRPFLIIKAVQVENALAFQATRGHTRGQRDGRHTTDQWAETERFLKRQQLLNKRGVI